MMKIILIRHGETIDNKNKICQGHKDGELSDLGKEQAKKLGKRFKDTKIDAIYSSDLKRAKNTADEISKHHPHIDIITDKRLREKYFGTLQGKPFPKDFDWKNPPKDVELNNDMLNRAIEFFEEIYPKHKNQTIILVTHGGTKRIFLTHFLNKDVEDMWTMQKPKNTSVTELDINENGTHHLIINNCTKHLE